MTSVKNEQTDREELCEISSVCDYRRGRYVRTSVGSLTASCQSGCAISCISGTIDFPFKQMYIQV